MRRIQCGQQERQPRFLSTREAGNHCIDLIGSQAKAREHGAQAGWAVIGAFGLQMLERCFVQVQLINLMLCKIANAQFVVGYQPSSRGLEPARDQF